MDVKLPNLGQGADTVTVVSLLVKPGTTVKKGQNLIELETGKAVAPIPSPADGVVSRLAVKEGDTLSVGQLILVLEGADGAAPVEPAGGGKPAAAAPKAPPSAAAPKAPPSAAQQPKSKADRAPRPEAPGEPAPEIAEGDHAEVEEVVNENPAAGPYARRLGRDLGIDLRVVRGSGKTGQIEIGALKAYIERLRQLALRPRVVPAPSPAAVAQAPTRPPPPAIDFSQWGPVSRKAVSQLRRTIAERMTESATTLPTVTQFDDADVTAWADLRKKFAADYEAKGARLT